MGTPVYPVSHWGPEYRAHTLPKAPAPPHTTTCVCTLSTPAPSARPPTHGRHDGVFCSPTLTVWSMGAVPVRSALEADRQDVGPVPRRAGCAGLQPPACVRPCANPTPSPVFAPQFVQWMKAFIPPQFAVL